MKQWTAYILFFSTLLIACTNNKGTESIRQLEKTAVRHFSDSLQADTFKVKITGDSPEQMQLLFTITSAAGKQLYNKHIKATELFSNYDATIDLNKKKNQVTFLKEEMDRFFDDENFLEPAITEQENPDKNVPDPEFYEELKQSQLNGFIYRLGKENKIYIGWSTKNSQVKVYYNCCK